MTNGKIIFKETERKDYLKQMEKLSYKVVWNDKPLKLKYARSLQNKPSTGLIMKAKVI